MAVAYNDGLWVSNESLNLWGYADRPKMPGDLHESFDYIYREIAEEADESLDDVAKKLKQKLRELVTRDDPQLTIRPMVRLECLGHVYSPPLPIVVH